MPIQDLIAIATFAIAILSIVFALGQHDQKTTVLEKDVNGLGKKISKESENNQRTQQAFDQRLDRLNEFAVRLDQRVLQLQEECFGQEKTNRLREIPIEKHHTTINESWYSENSGIEL